MAEVIWAESALSDLDAIGDYIALDNPEGGESFGAERALTCGHLVVHPKSGSKPQELKGWRYRQMIVEPPCRIFYREEGSRVFIFHNHARRTVTPPFFPHVALSFREQCCTPILPT